MFDTTKTPITHQVADAIDLAIDFATLGGDAGYIGAAGVARLDYQRDCNATSSHYCVPDSQ